MTVYSGSLVTPDGELPIEVDMTVRFEPVDGKVHWGGRIAPNPSVAALVRGGMRTCQVRIDVAVPARLGDPDPWGGVRVTGVGPPPVTTRAG
jgi:hypothetical protein